MALFLSLCSNVQAAEVKLEQVNFNADFITRMIPRLEWPAVCEAAESVSFDLCLSCVAYCCTVHHATHVHCCTVVAHN